MWYEDTYNNLLVTKSQVLLRLLFVIYIIYIIIEWNTTFQFVVVKIKIFFHASLEALWIYPQTTRDPKTPEVFAVCLAM